mmetsp:Transcript_17056/g.24657  ORF Transcript_17056/g.24657 Transcript_17056/m.24657 type:complete len:276 (+) Transcript_17056:137-964(+)
MMQINRIPHETPGSSSRTNGVIPSSFGQGWPNSVNRQIFQRNAAESSISEQKGAALLLSMANIVEKEIGQDGVNWEDDIPLSPSLEDLPFQLSSSILPSDGSQSLKKYSMRSALTTLQDDSSWKRIRTVSMDARDENTPRATSPRLSPRLSSKTAPSLVSPVGSPLQSRGRSLRKPKSVSIKKKPQMIPPSSPRTRSLQPKEAVKGSTVKTILRKKFSWKNFPEVSSVDLAEFKLPPLLSSSEHRFKSNRLFVFIKDHLLTLLLRSIEFHLISSA